MSTLSGREVAAATFVMEMEEVLVARITSERVTPDSSAKSLRFTSTFSTAA